MQETSQKSFLKLSLSEGKASLTGTVEIPVSEEAISSFIVDIFGTLLQWVKSSLRTTTTTSCSDSKTSTGS